MSTISSFTLQPGNSGDLALRACTACILGGAIGDALGMPFERVAAAEIRKVCPGAIRSFFDPVPSAPCHQYGLKKGMYTDDTQAVRATMRGIITQGSLSAKVVAEALHEWLFGFSLGEQPRYPGQTTVRAIDRYRTNRDPRACGVHSLGCGAAIRISPVALWLTLHGNGGFVGAVEEIAAITHTSRTALDGAVLVSVLISTGLQGVTPTIDELYPFCQSPLMKTAIGHVATALERGTAADAVAELIGGGTGAHEVVPMSIYHLYRTCFSFNDTMASGLDTLHRSGTDLDSILSISGALAGVRFYRQVEESPWRSGLEEASAILSEAAELYAAATR